ncbi:MAG: hypothetical protein A3H32_14985 [Betaproteobacteria bacterium RIFCSPLOWO2_02_FULL_63_19]|nr:MAG: hypothetical protein A3H32_14985 [Betaproteobacteria bacterium RIFCSPLOWO2_02_FULL_63_19]
MNTSTRKTLRGTLLAGALCACLAVLSSAGRAEDIDIFVTNSAAAATFDNPNVLIILDNTSNWSQAAQQWPNDPDTGEAQRQGKAELRAIKAVVNELDDTINVGLMLFTDTGTGREGGYIRFPVLQMTAANKTALATLVQYIYDNFSSPAEKTSSSANYSAVMFDAFKYFGGWTSPANVASNTAGSPVDATHFGPAVFNQRTDLTLSHVGGYTDATRVTYAGPITADNACAKNFVIFIGNGFPNSDIGSPANMDTYLSGIGGDTAQIAVPGFNTTTAVVATPLGYTAACYASQAVCQTTGFALGTYEYLSCSGTSKTTLDACPAGQSRYNVLGNVVTESTATSTTTTTVNGETTACYASAPSAAGLTGNQFGMTCPSTSVVQAGNVTTTTTYDCSYAIGAPTASSCGDASDVTTVGSPTVSNAPSTACYAKNSTGDAAAVAANNTAGADHGGLTCTPTQGPTTEANTTTTITYACTWENAGRTTTGAACANTVLTGGTAGTDVVTTSFTNSCYGNSGAANTGIAAGDHGNLICPGATTSAPDGNGVVTVTEYACSYTRATGAGTTSSSGCASGNDRYTVIQTATPTTHTEQTNTRHLVAKTETPSTRVVTAAVTGQNHFAVTQTRVATATAVTTTTASTVLGNTAACYATPPTGTPSEFSCSGFTNCSYGGTTTSASCPSGARFEVVGNNTTTTVVGNNTFAVPASSKRRMTDEWARYMYRADANSAAPQQSITTYTIDVFNAQQSADQTGLLMSMARAGGGKYFAAKSKNAVINALRNILSEIQAVNTVFASASLPVNATNRAQNENQVFIGMFRPDSGAKPRWYGNVKRYQLADFSGLIDLADVNGDQAVNLQTGFLAECAQSYWTSDSGPYWQIVPDAIQGRCTSSANSPWSDSPDGPMVEKGAAAEVMRKGNNPPATDTTPTWTLNRTIKTASGTTLVDFNAANTGLSQDLVDFIAGKDVNNELATPNAYFTTPDPFDPATVIRVRPSIHGDVVHSRPVPVNYNTATDTSKGVTVFYGANDGTLRAVNASTGKERWAFVAPSFLSRLSRLKTNSPIIQFPNQTAGIVPTPVRKDYFWDGSMGLFQNADNTAVWLYPTMRRGGRVLYGLDITDPDVPAVLWKMGCPNLGDDTGCTLANGSAGMTGIGQTWSTPVVAYIKGYPTAGSEEPVLVIGGGYDSCEDTNSSTTGCSSPKGAAIYIIKASDGTLIRTLTLSGMHSVASDVAMVDVNNDGFVDFGYVGDTAGVIYRVDFVRGWDSYSVRDYDEWRIRKVAYTDGSSGAKSFTGPRKFLFPPALLYSNGQVYVAMGSGDREHPLAGDYAYSDTLNRFYVFLDRLSKNPSDTCDLDNDLCIRPLNLDDTSLMNDNTSTTSCTDEKLLATSAKRGWFMDLDQYGQGEQTVTSALILGGLVTFSTNRPIPPAAASCSLTLGEARGYWVNLLNGSGGIGTPAGTTCGGDRSGVFVGGGLPPSPVTGVVPVNGVSRTVVIGAVQKDGTASAPIGGQKVVPAIKPTRKRVYWFKNIDN